MNLEANIQVGDFRIERRLGAGGMGVVYRARQVALGRTVALKILGPALSRESDIVRFRREAQAIAKLCHPSIVAIHYAGQDGRVCFIAMEYIEGASLRAVIDRLAAVHDRGLTFDQVVAALPLGGEEAPELRFDEPTATYTPRLDGPAIPTAAPVLTDEAKALTTSPAYVRRCIEIVRDAALALGHAHERGVIHRDVKPENLLLDRQRRLHVIDFGLARFFEDATATSTGALIGTPMYMSPEQVAGRISVDPRTDVYSLGVVLYELLTLRRPIPANTREGILRHVLTKALRPVSWENRAAVGDVENVVHKATSKDPDDRYATAAAFAADLESLLERRAVSAGPYHYRADEREIAARRPGAVVAAAAIFYVLSIGAMLSAGMSVLTLLYIWYSVYSRIVVRDFDEYSMFTRLIVAVLAIAIGLTCYRVAAALLAGRSWAHRAAVLIALFLPFVWTGAVTYLARPLFMREFRSWEARDMETFTIVGIGVVVLWVLGVSAPVAGSILLLGRRTREWFRFAAQLRAEHEPPVSH